MHVGRKTQKREKSAMSVSLYGNLLFVVIELIMAIVTSSQAVLLDAVYDGVEFVMLLPSLFLIPFLYRPANEQHPFGYTQIETLFIVIKGIEDEIEDVMDRDRDLIYCNKGYNDDSRYFWINF